MTEPRCPSLSQARKSVRLLACALLLAASAESRGAEAEKPVDLDLVEKAQVRMVIVDVLVLDRQRRTVPGLSAADFEVMVDGTAVTVATVDGNCPAGAAEDPTSAYRSKGASPVTAPAGDRKIVLAFDYQHLEPLRRTDVLERAREMIEAGAGDRDEVMVVALTGGLRIEQPFSTDRERTRRTLRRMEYDVTLWNGTFSHQNEGGFVRGMEALFDVLRTMPGRKAVVFYSGMNDVPLDSQFRHIAALAAGARCSIYPVEAGGLVSGLRPVRPRSGAG